MGNTGRPEARVIFRHTPKMLEIASEQLVGNVRGFVQHFARGEVICGESGKMTYLVEVPSTGEIYLFANGKIPRIYLRKVRSLFRPLYFPD